MTTISKGAAGISPEILSRIEDIVASYSYQKMPQPEKGMVYDADAYKIILPRHTRFGRQDKAGDCAEITNDALFKLRREIPELNFYAARGTHDDYFPYPWVHNFIVASPQELLGIRKAAIDYERKGTLTDFLVDAGALLIDPSLHAVLIIGEDIGKGGAASPAYFVEAVSRQKGRNQHSLDGIFTASGDGWSKAAIGLTSEGTAYIQPNSMNERDWRIGFVKNGSETAYALDQPELFAIAEKEPLVRAWIDFFQTARVYK
ncbi:hypothetical protein D6764_02720 [Candidatus Woesearchaeota archaeon]|nr:MAG: hypothetical protein D6764_02720 [Candidatus Woesearchaeota archaeon]